MYSLPNNLYSPQDILQVINNIDKLSSALSQQKIKDSALPKLPQKLDSLIKTNELVISSTNLQSLKEWLKDVLKTAPRIKMTLADEPRGSLISKLIVWIRTETGDKTLLDIRVDERLIGGFVMQTPNHLIDESWKTKLEKADSDLGALIHGIS